MIHNGKPVRKCHSCQLNLGEQCAIYDVPRDMWHGRHCPGHNNEEMLQRYMEQQAKTVDKKNKEQRRAEFKLRRTKQHEQGLRVHGF